MNVGILSIPLACWNTAGNPVVPLGREALKLVIVGIPGTDSSCTRSTDAWFVQMIRGFTVQVYSNEPFCATVTPLAIPSLSKPSPSVSGEVAFDHPRL